MGNRMGFGDFRNQTHRCDICGKARSVGNHKKCAEIRKQRGFDDDRKERK